MEPMELLESITDNMSLRILSASFKQPKTAKELSRKLNFPVAACYKKIRKLTLIGMIRCVGKTLSEKGKSIRCYQSQVKGAYVQFTGNRLRARMELTQPKNRMYDRTWNLTGKMQKRDPVKE